jgi:hypothetical protein
MISGRVESVCAIFTNTGPSDAMPSLTTAPRVRLLSMTPVFSSHVHVAYRRVATAVTSASRAATSAGADWKYAPTNKSFSATSRSGLKSSTMSSRLPYAAARRLIASASSPVGFERMVSVRSRSIFAYASAALNCSSYDPDTSGSPVSAPPAFGEPFSSDSSLLVPASPPEGVAIARRADAPPHERAARTRWCRPAPRAPATEAGRAGTREPAARARASVARRGAGARLSSHLVPTGQSVAPPATAYAIAAVRALARRLPRRRHLAERGCGSVAAATVQAGEPSRAPRGRARGACGRFCAAL